MTIVFKGDFESGDLRGFYWQHNKPEVVIAPHPVRAGSYSMRSYLHHYDSRYSFKTMVHVCDDDQGTPDDCSTFRFDIGSEYWIGMSTYLPADWVDDVDSCNDLIWQFQASPDDGESYRSPLLAIYIDEDQYKIWNRWDTRAITPGGDMDFQGSKLLWSGSTGPDKGQWVDWVFNVHWSWHSDGRMKIWKDGSVIAERTGPNCSNDERGPYTSFGVYKWPWKPGNEGKYPDSVTDYRLAYYDELRIGDANSSYQEVSPRGESPEPLDPEEVIIQEALSLRDAMRLPMPLSFKYPAVLREHGYSQGAGFGHKEINGRMWGWQIGFNLDGESAVAYSPEDNYDATILVKLP